MIDAAVQIASVLCRRFEGLFLRPYLCPAGVPTIGYGATYYRDGRRVKLSDPAITRALEALGRSGVPVYVVYAPGKPPVVLSEVLSVDEVRKALAGL